MRADLSNVYACINWAINQLGILHTKIEAWQDNAPFGFREEPRPEIGKKIIRLARVTQPGADINVEVGMIIHALRSALDILVVRLAEREGHEEPRDVSFPIRRTAEEFDEAVKNIARLSVADKAAIRALKPYRVGGDFTLYALHQLDIMRKHRRLIAVRVAPVNYTVPEADVRSGLGFPPTWNGFEEDAIVAWTNIDAAAPAIRILPQIVFEDTTLVDGQ